MYLGLVRGLCRACFNLYIRKEFQFLATITNFKQLRFAYIVDCYHGILCHCGQSSDQLQVHDVVIDQSGLNLKHKK